MGPFPADPMPCDDRPSFGDWIVEKPGISQTEFKSLSGIFKNACQGVFGKDFSLTFGDYNSRYLWNVKKPEVASKAEFKKLDRAFKEACETALGRNFKVTGKYSDIKNRHSTLKHF